MGGTYTVSKVALKRMLTTLGISERNTDDLLNNLNKTHRHSNAVTFVGMLQKLGLKSDDMANILRRIGIDDISITKIFNTLDEERIKSAYGRVVEVKVE